MQLLFIRNFQILQQSWYCLFFCHQHCIDVAVREKQMLNFVVEQVNAVTDALLTKTAKAVKVLTHLTWCGAHNFSQLAGGNPCFARSFKLGYVSEISRQTTDNR